MIIVGCVIAGIVVLVLAAAAFLCAAHSPVLTHPRPQLTCRAAPHRCPPALTPLGLHPPQCAEEKEEAVRGTVVINLLCESSPCCRFSDFRFAIGGWARPSFQHSCQRRPFTHTRTDCQHLLLRVGVMVPIPSLSSHAASASAPRPCLCSGPVSISGINNVLVLPPARARARPEER